MGTEDLEKPGAIPVPNRISSVNFDQIYNLDLNPQEIGEMIREQKVGTIFLSKNLLNVF